MTRNKNRSTSKITPILKAKLSLACVQDKLDYLDKNGTTDQEFTLALCIKHIQSALQDIITEMEAAK